MAKCKVCRTNIPEGNEYCDNCHDKELNSKESYLDSLLNSVKNTAQTADNIYKKKKSSSINSANADSTKDNNYLLQKSEDNFEDELTYSLDMDDVIDFDNYSIDDDLAEFTNDIIIGDEDIFGEEVLKLLSEDNSGISQQEVTEQVDTYNVPDYGSSSEIDNTNEINTTFNYKGTLDEINTSTELNSSIDYKGTSDLNNTANLESFTEDYFTDQYNNEDDTKPDELESELAVTLELDPPELDTVSSMDGMEANQAMPYDMSEFEAEEDFDTDLNNLLNSLEQADSEASEENESYDYNAYDEVTNLDEFNGYDPMEAEDDDFLELLNQISSDDPVVEDVKAINSLLNGGHIEDQSKASMPSDVGEVFSDALKVVSSLNDNNIDEDELLENIPDKKSKIKKKKDKKQKKNNSDGQSDLEQEEAKPKISIWKKLFANIKDENTAKKEQSKNSIGEAGGVSKKADKKVKTPKGKKGKATTVDEDDTDNDKDKENSSNVKEKAKKAKKDKKDKQKKQKEIIQVIDEIDEDDGRINRLGAFIVFMFFGLLALLLIVGTNVVSYTISIQNATKYFEKQKYTQAYNEVYGMEIKDEDIEIYDKIRTVMFVNKQLNSYNNYYSIGKYPEALDSLLKGLRRYDKYIELATKLGIDTDMNYVREQILAELENVFKITEKEAMRINSFESMSEYSMEVYDVVLENMNN